MKNQLLPAIGLIIFWITWFLLVQSACDRLDHPLPDEERSSIYTDYQGALHPCCNNGADCGADHVWAVDPITELVYRVDSINLATQQVLVVPIYSAAGLSVCTAPEWMDYACYECLEVKCKELFTSVVQDTCQ